MAVDSGIGRVTEFSLATALLSSSNDVREYSTLLQALYSVVLGVSYEHVARLVETDSHGFLEFAYSSSRFASLSSDSTDTWGMISFRIREIFGSLRD